MINPQFLPADLPAEQIVACIGLISDTHMPERCAALPPAIFTALQGVDLLLHAGDVGELWVLDRLSAIAPIVAVHGNDDTADSQRELPYQQLIALAGQRIMLTHGHFADPSVEQALLRRGEWEPVLAQHTIRAQQAGASIFVSGHTHVPIATLRNGVLLINPGAIAPGTYKLRQRVQTIAVLFLADDGTTYVSHIDMASQSPFEPVIDFASPFVIANSLFSESILAPELELAWENVKPLRALVPDAFHRAVLRAAHRCWSGERASMTTLDLLNEIKKEPAIPDAVMVQFEYVLSK